MLHRSKRMVLDSIGVGLIGSTTDVFELALQHCQVRHRGETKITLLRFLIWYEAIRQIKAMAWPYTNRSRKLLQQLCADRWNGWKKITGYYLNFIIELENGQEFCVWWPFPPYFSLTYDLERVIPALKSLYAMIQSVAAKCIKKCLCENTVFIFLCHFSFSTCMRPMTSALCMDVGARSSPQHWQLLSMEWQWV